MGWKNFHSWSWGAVTLKTAWHGRESAGMHQQLKTTVKALMSEFLPFLSSFNISSNVIAYSCGVRSTWHALLPTKPNLSVWGFTMPKGFGIGHHIREIPGTSKSAPTFGHTVGRERKWFTESILPNNDILLFWWNSPVKNYFRENEPWRRGDTDRCDAEHVLSPPSDPGVCSGFTRSSVGRRRRLEA